MEEYERIMREESLEVQEIFDELHKAQDGEME